MKLATSPRVGIKDPDLQRELREHAQQVNALSEGRIAANYNAATAVPTTGLVLNAGTLVSVQRVLTA